MASLVAVVGTVLFTANERQEAKTVYQYNRQTSFWGTAGGYATVLFLALFCAFIAYFALLVFVQATEIRAARFVELAIWPIRRPNVQAVALVIRS